LVHLIALSTFLVSTAPCACDAPSTRAFADALLAEGDAYRAIGEYKRFLFLVPEGPDADAAHFAMGLAYLRGGQSQAAAELYDQLAEQGPRLSAEARLQAGYARYVGGQSARAAENLTRWLRQEGPTASTPSRLRATYLLGWAELASGGASSAAHRFQALPDFLGKKSLVEQTLAFDALPSRSPVVAGLLSIIPGLGHVYIGQPAVGAAALSWNALFGLALYDAIRNKQLGLSLLLGSLESLWYIGTIFGAISGAFKFNRDARQNALDEMRETFDDRPESWPPAPPIGRF